MASVNRGSVPIPVLHGRTCAQILVQYLRLEGVEHVFGVSGGTIIALLEALDAEPGIRFVMAKHEGGAAFMADAYARVRDALGVCLATAGPGATNLVTGVAGAQQDGVPVLALTGQPATHTQGKGAVQESSAFGVDVVGLFRQLTGFSGLVSEPAVLQQLVTQALRVALGDKRQAAHLSLPSNVAAATLPAVELPRSTDSYRVSHSAIDHEKIGVAAGILAAAVKPAILIGAGTGTVRALDDLLQIAEMLRCPVMTTPSGKGLFPESHPLSLGVFGFAGSPCAKAYLLDGEVDVLVVISSRLDEWETDSWDKRIAPARHLVQFDVDPQNIGRNYPVGLGIVGDIAAAVKELLIKLIRILPKRPARGVECFGEIAEYKNRIGMQRNPALLEADDLPLKPQRLMADLNRCLEPDAIVLADAGNAYSWAIHCLRIDPPQRFIAALGFASMGYAAAGVVGAALAAPGRQVIAVTGDGSMLMNGNEVHTAVEYGVPAIWLVLNDGGWGMVYHGNKAVTGRELCARYHQVDLAGFAAGHGALGYRVTEPGELARIMPEIMERRLPAVIDARIDPEEEPPFLERVKAVLLSMREAGS